MAMFMFIPSLMAGDTAAFISKLAVVVLLWTLVALASVVDLFTGISASRRVGNMKTSSWGLRKTITKDLEYFALLAVLLCIDVAVSALSTQFALFSVPVFSIIGVFAEVGIEALSVNENIHKGKQPEDDNADVIALATKIAGAIGADKAKEILKVVQDQVKN